METKKKNTSKAGTKPVHTVRRGAIAANFFGSDKRPQDIHILITHFPAYA